MGSTLLMWQVIGLLENILHHTSEAMRKKVA